MLIEIRSFELQAGASPTGRVELAARVVAEGGRVLAARTFEASAPSSSDDASAAAFAIDQAFGRVAADLATWVRGLPIERP